MVRVLSSLTFSRRGNQIQEAQLAQPAGSSDAIHPSVFGFMCSVSRPMLSLQMKDSQVLEAQTPGRHLSGLSGAPMVTTHPLSSSTLADGEADKNPQDLFHPNTKHHGLRIRCIPPR